MITEIQLMASITGLVCGHEPIIVNALLIEAQGMESQEVMERLFPLSLPLCPSYGCALGQWLMKS